MRTPSFSARQSPRENRLLAALPEEDYARLLPRLELVPMPLGRVLCEFGDAQGNVFFPTTSIVANCCVMQDGSSTQVAVAGNEGAVGVALFMGGRNTTSRAGVYSAGYGYRLGSSVLKVEFAHGGNLQHLLLRYTQALMTQIAQTAVCNRHHSVEQQLCRLLLQSLDRLAFREMTLSHELIGGMLGVRRESVSSAAAKLRAAGLIDYNAGHVIAFDRQKLEAAVCECYAVVRAEYERLLPRAAPPSPWQPSRIAPVTSAAAPRGCFVHDAVAQG